MINVGGGGANQDKKKAKSKRPKMINVNAKDGDQESDVEEKKVVSKVDLNALLAGGPSSGGAHKASEK